MYNGWWLDSNRLLNKIFGANTFGVQVYPPGYLASMSIMKEARDIMLKHSDYFEFGKLEQHKISFKQGEGESIEDQLDKIDSMSALPIIVLQKSPSVGLFTH